MSVTTWRLAYSTTLASAATSVTISSLTGDTDVVYRLTLRIVNAVGTAALGLRINNDSTAGIYGLQCLVGTSTIIAAARDTSESTINLNYSNVSDANTILQSEHLIYAKTGYVRTLLSLIAGEIATTTIDEIWLQGDVYNETSTEVTSLVVLSNQTNGLGVGTVIELWKPAEWTAPVTSTFTPKVYIFS